MNNESRITWHSAGDIFPNDGSICLVKLFDCNLHKPCGMTVAVCYDNRFYIPDFSDLYSIKISDPDNVSEKALIVPCPNKAEERNRVVFHTLEYFDMMLAISEYAIIGNTNERKLRI